MLALQQRLMGGNRVHWRSADVDRIAKRFGASAADVAGMVLRYAGNASPMTIELDASASDTKLKQATFTISTASVDRMGDTIAVDGWRLENFRANPIVQYAHDSGSLPVGKALQTWIEGGKLKSIVQFDNDRFAQRVAAMVKGGTLRASSVGFSPGQWDFSQDKARPFGIDFKSGHELLEWSIVNIPANPDALLQSTSAAKSASGKTPALDMARRRLVALQARAS